MKAPPIEHVVVLLFENRSFDHLLGYLPHPGRLTGRESNPLDPANPRLGRVRVSSRAEYGVGPDPLHDLANVNLQLFGSGPLTADLAPLSGFVKSYTEAARGDVEVGKRVMQCFAPGRLPALTALAREYCLCTRWFSSVPGPTWPNRFFVHSATSDGVATNDVLHAFDRQTIYDSLAARGLSWNIYFHDFPHSIALRNLWERRDRFRKYSDFATDIQRGLLPNYSFIEPRYFELLGWRANDFHPPHDERFADDLIADVYGLLRKSSAWERTVLIVLFDEHGGYFDHVSPPRGVPNPDGQVSADPPFDFTRLGLRVPAVIASPWIEKGRVETTIFEHASVPATVSKLFGLNSFLTARDAAANTFEALLALSAPRDDAPGELPTLTQSQEVTSRDLEAVAPGPAPLSEFQETLVQLADQLGGAPQPLEAVPRDLIVNEQQAGGYVQGQIARFLQ